MIEISTGHYKIKMIEELAEANRREQSRHRSRLI
jgi:hypothetical protein